MANLADLLAAVTAAEDELAKEREKALKWFGNLKPERRLLSPEDRHKELAQFAAFFGSVGLLNSNWWKTYEAYRREVDADNERRDRRTNCFMVAVTVVLAAIGFWQGYEAHRQTLALRAPPAAPQPIVIPAPAVTVNVLPAPIMQPALGAKK